jgi:predicted deacylase
MKEKIFSTKSPLGEPITFFKNIWRGNESENILSIVAGLQGDSLNGIYIASKLSKFLSDIENGIEKDYALTGTIQVFPLVNLRAIENANSLWEFDNLNLDMAFPGNQSGDLNEKICGSLLRHTDNSTYGIILQAGEKHFQDFPHIKMLESSRQKRKLAEWFDLEIVRTIPNTPPRNLHLASHWEDKEVETFVVSAGKTQTLDPKVCDLIFEGLKSFMLNAELINYRGTLKRNNQIKFFKPDNEVILATSSAGLFQANVDAGENLKKGQKVGNILEIYSGETIDEIIAPANGRLISLLQHTFVHQQETIGTLLTDKKGILSWPFS